MNREVATNDPHAEVKRLQEQVKALKYQLSQQISTKVSSELLSDLKSCDISEEIIGVYKLDFCNTKCWLMPTNRPPANLDPDPLGWCLDYLNAYPFNREKLYRDICAAEQGHKSSIDTRTYTRPKKRLGRPSLDILSTSFSQHSPIEESRENDPVPNFVYPSLETPRPKFGTPSSAWNRNPSESDYISNMTDSLLVSSTLFSSMISEADSDLSINSVILSNNNFEKVIPDIKSNDVGVLSTNSIHDSVSGSNSSGDDLNSRTVVTNSAYIQNSSEDSIHPANDTFEIPNLNGTHDNFASPQQTNLNETFTKNSYQGSNSVDSTGYDDDQLSSASESSNTSTNRLLSVGDVQNIARMQEESLSKSVVASTPYKVVKDSTFSRERSFSPIDKDSGSESGQHEMPVCDSDHSSHSLNSSVHSSPVGSPYGSRTRLALPNHYQNYSNRVPHSQAGGRLRPQGYSSVPTSAVEIPAPQIPLRPSRLLAPRIRATGRTSVLPRPVAPNQPSNNVPSQRGQPMSRLRLPAVRLNFAGSGRNQQV